MSDIKIIQTTRKSSYFAFIRHPSKLAPKQMCMIFAQEFCFKINNHDFLIIIKKKIYSASFYPSWTMLYLLALVPSWSFLILLSLIMSFHSFAPRPVNLIIENAKWILSQASFTQKRLRHWNFCLSNFRVHMFWGKFWWSHSFSSAVNIWNQYHIKTTCHPSWNFLQFFCKNCII